MNDYGTNDRSSFSGTFMAALVGGLAGALVVYFSDEKKRRKVMEKVEDFINEGEMKRQEIKEKIDDTMERGRKTVAKKLRQAEENLSKT